MHSETFPELWTSDGLGLCFRLGTRLVPFHSEFYSLNDASTMESFVRRSGALTADSPGTHGPYPSIRCCQVDEISNKKKNHTQPCSVHQLDHARNMIGI